MNWLEVVATVQGPAAPRLQRLQVAFKCLEREPLYIDTARCTLHHARANFQRVGGI